MVQYLGAAEDQPIDLLISGLSKEDCDMNQEIRGHLKSAPPLTDALQRISFSLCCKNNFAFLIC